MSIGTNMRNYRQRLGLSVAAAAGRAGLNVEQWETFETDAAVPDVAALLPIATALNVPLTELTSANPLRLRAEVATRVSPLRMPNTSDAAQRTEAVRQQLLRLLDVDALLRAEHIGIGR